MYKEDINIVEEIMKAVGSSAEPVKVCQSLDSLQMKQSKYDFTLHGNWSRQLIVNTKLFTKKRM